MPAWSAFHFFSYALPIGTELAHQSPEILPVVKRKVDESAEQK
jgi:hypothetical protein